MCDKDMHVHVQMCDKGMHGQDIILVIGMFYPGFVTGAKAALVTLVNPLARWRKLVWQWVNV